MNFKDDMPDAHHLIPLTVFVVYDRAETARRFKETLDRANAEFHEVFEFDLRLWRLDILELLECRDPALQDLEDADLLTMVFSSHGDSLFSPELNYMVNKWSEKDGGKNCALFSDRSEPACKEISVESLRSLVREAP